MYRVFAIGLGSLLVGLGIVWFFTSLLDGLAARLVGHTDLTPLTKMYLGDEISLLVALLSIMGAGLLLIMNCEGIENCNSSDASATENN